MSETAKPMPSVEDPLGDGPNGLEDLVPGEDVWIVDGLMADFEIGEEHREALLDALANASQQFRFEYKHLFDSIVRAHVPKQRAAELRKQVDELNRCGTEAIAFASDFRWGVEARKETEAALGALVSHLLAVAADAEARADAARTARRSDDNAPLRLAAKVLFDFWVGVLQEKFRNNHVKPKGGPVFVREALKVIGVPESVVDGLHKKLRGATPYELRQGEQLIKTDEPYDGADDSNTTVWANSAEPVAAPFNDRNPWPRGQGFFFAPDANYKLTNFRV